jgi:chromosome segregation ATPase
MPDAPPAVPDLNEKLAALKGQDQENQAKVDAISKENVLVRQNISTLETGIGQIDQIITNYAMQNLRLAADKSSLQAFVEKQMKIATAGMTDEGKAALDASVTAIVTKVDADIEKQAKLTTDLQAAADKAKAAQAAAETAANEKQAAYDEAKATLNRAQAKISDAKTLQGQLNSAVAAGNSGDVYVLALAGEMKKVLGSINLPTQDDLKAQLNTALSDLHIALSDAREKKQTSDAAAAALTPEQKKLNDVKVGRLAALLDAAKKWKPAERPA